MLVWIKDKEDFEEIQKKNKKFFVLVFYGAFSSSAKRALNELSQFERENEKIPIYIIDVEKVKGVHKQFGVQNVPTVLALENGKVTRRIEGLQSAKLYTRILLGAHPSSRGKSKGTTPHRVIVYTGSGCPACAAAKAYLRGKGIVFREVDIARDRHAAQRLVQRSGQMAVPQIDIDGHLVVGFDQVKIDKLLSK